MQEKKYNTTKLINKSLDNLTNNIVFDKNLDDKSIMYSLFAIITLDIMANKEDLVEKDIENKYTNLMSDNTIDNIYERLHINKENYNMNESTFFAKLRGTIAHGQYYIENDKIVLNIQTGNNEYKECDVLLDDFINYYCELTDFIDGRINEKKFVIYEMFNKNEDTLTTLSSNDKCIKEYLNGIIFKKITFSKISNENLLTQEKFYLNNLIFRIRSKISEKNNNHYNNKFFDNILTESIKNSPFSIGITNSKVSKKFDKLKDIVGKIIDFYNKTDIQNINPYVTEQLYNYMYNEIEEKQYKNGLLRTKYALYHMYKNKINSFKDYIDISFQHDEYYALSYPVKEQRINILIAMLYFNYCYPLENNFKLNNKIENKEDLSFINLDFNKIKECVIVNKLFENKINNYIRELSEKKTSLQNNLRRCEIGIENKLNSLQYLKDEQKNRVEKELKELRDKLEKINESIKNIEKELDELLNLTSSKNINYYNYTIIKGIRDSLAHGNITYKNIYYNDVKDTLIEFTDYYRNEIKFKLTIRINDLIYLFENKNIDVLNNFYNEKLLKKSTK